MKYKDNMSYKAMEKRLDVSVSALKVRVYRAKKELKRFIEQRG
jgi:RNA polymerase sigma-70 factor (ECF subfamily)